MLILMEHSAESVVPSYVKACDLVRGCQRLGQWLERADDFGAVNGAFLAR
jgi:hypothetical protein